MKCISLWLIETTILPDRNDEWTSNWQGVIMIDQQINNLLGALNQSNIQSALQQMGQINVSLLEQEYQSRQQQIYQLYDEFNGKELINPNPITVGDKAFIQSNYIEQLGPPSRVGSATQMLKQELQGRERTIFNINYTGNISKQFYSSMEETKQRFIKTRSGLDEFSLRLIQFLAQIDSKLNDKSWLIDSAVRAYKNYLLLVCATCLLTIVSFSLVTWLRLQKMSFLLHCSWIMMSWLLMAGLGILAFVYYTAMIDNNIVCNIAKEMMNDDKILRLMLKYVHKKHLKHSQTMTLMEEELSTCLYRAGNLIQYFGVEEPVDQISEMHDKIRQLGMAQATKSILNANLKEVNNILVNYGGAVNSSEVDNPNDVLTIFNQWSNFNGNSLQFQVGNCRVTQDEWEWNDSLCNYNSYYVPNSSPDYEFGWTICFNFDEVPANFAQKRYGNVQFGQCNPNIPQFANISSALDEYFMQLNAYIGSVKRVFEPLLSSLNEYDNEIDELDYDIQRKIQELQGSGEQLNNLFVPITNGIETSMNCSFLADGATRMKNSFCVTLLNGLFFMYIYLITICCLQSLALIFSVWAAMRCIPKSEQHMVFMEASTVNMQITEQKSRRVQI